MAFSGLTGLAQSAKDYFFPKPEKNSSLFKMANGMSNPEFETQVFFKEMGDSAVITTAFNRQEGIVVGQEQLVKFSDSEIMLVNVKASTSSGIVNYDGDGTVIFKIPSHGKKTEWTPGGQPGAVIQTYTSTFCHLKVDGKRKKAIKVTTINQRKRGGRQQVFYSDYYVEGIGRYKRTSESGLNVEILADQKYVSTIPTLN
jgi:hypothetical protein